MTLVATSIDWAIEFVLAHSDGDLFPRVEEIEAVRASKADFIALVEGKPLADFTPGPHRRFLIQKDEASFRQATQLDPQDSILLSAVIHQFGSGIEQRRLGPAQVYSYRFAPTTSHGLYGNQGAWTDFWKTAKAHALSSPQVVYCDIADFYNQVYHHEVENQMIASGFPNQAVKWVIALIESTTAGVSRGVPIGPHAAHLLAESTLIPIDSSLRDSGLQFVRYADDYVFFCADARACRSVLATVARVLDQPQRLMLQRHKTKILGQAEFLQMCDQMLDDRALSGSEQSVLEIIRKYSGGDPYTTVAISRISAHDISSITPGGLRSIIEDYLAQRPIDYVRLRWLYRRLAQIGHPGAVEVSLDHVSELAPCFANICFYFASIQQIPANE